MVWARVLAVLERLALSSDLGEILSLINDSMRDCLDAERSSVFRYDAERGELVAEQAHGMNGVLRFPAGSGLAGEAVRSRSIINVPDCYADPRFNQGVDQRTGFRTRCMLSIPLMSLDGKLEGVAQVLNKRVLSAAIASPLSGAASFTAEDETIARALASQAAVAIRRASLLEAERRKNKMEADLRVAREIQAATLPKQLPTIPGYTLAACLVAAEETAGDCYDLIHIKGGDDPVQADRLWIFVADATGHGIGPAIAVAQAHAMFCLGVRAGLSLDDILGHMNARLQESLPMGRFVCAFLGELNLATHELRYASAGLSPIVRVRLVQPTADHDAGSQEGSHDRDELGSTHPPLGLEETLEGTALASMTLEEGDGLIVATDGIYEQPNKEGKPIGTRMIVDQAVRACSLTRSDNAFVRGQSGGRGAHATELMNGILEAASDSAGFGKKAISPRDDQTIVVLARNEK